LLALLALTGRLTFLEIAVLLSITVCCNTIQTLAYTASITLLVDSEHLGRANGVAQTGGAISTVLAPLLAGALVLTVGLFGVLLIDVGTYLVAFLAILLSKIPSPEGALRTSDRAALRTVLSEASSGLRHIAGNLSLLQVCLYLAVVNFAYTMVNVLKPPLLLSFTSAAGLGKLLSIEGTGFFLGTLLMSIYGAPRNSVKGVVLGAASQGVALMMIAVRPSFALTAAGLLFGAITLPLMTTSNLVLLQRNTAPKLQGRVLAASQLIVQGTEPIAVLMAGPLADKIFVPALLPNGRLAHVFGSWFGVGQERGLALMVGLASLLIVAASIVAALLPRQQARDETADQPGAAMTPAASDNHQLCPDAPYLDSAAPSREYTSRPAQIL
jgi:MFS family permease